MEIGNSNMYNFNYVLFALAKRQSFGGNKKSIGSSCETFNDVENRAVERLFTLTF